MWVDRGALGHLIFYVLFFHDLYTILNMFSTYSKRTPSILKKCSPECLLVFVSKTKSFSTPQPSLWIITVVIVVIQFHGIRKACVCPICPICPWWFAATTVVRFITTKECLPRLHQFECSDNYIVIFVVFFLCMKK